MRILFIANIFPPLKGGSSTVYGNICRHLGSNVVVLTPSRNYVTGQTIPGWRESDALQQIRIVRPELLRPVLRPAPAPVIGSAWRYLGEDLPLRRNVRRDVFHLLEEQRPDIVCLGELHNLAWLGPELRRIKQPFIQFIHGEEITTVSKSLQLRHQGDAVLREANAIVAVSSFTRDRLVDAGVRSQSIHVVTNGVDTSHFTPGGPSESLLARHGISGKRVLLTVARLEQKKGQDNVIRAMSHIRSQVPNAVYLIVGEGSYRSRLELLTKELGLEDAVKFVGEVKDAELCDYYRTCDVFIMANRAMPDGDTEGFGLVFLEAAACQKAVIGGRAGGVIDAVVDQVTGILVDSSSIPEIAETATRLLQDRQLATRLGAAGASRAAHSDWKSKAAEFLRVCAVAATPNPGAYNSLRKR